MVTRVRKQKNADGTFAPGHKMSVGHKGPRGNPLTQVLISQLNEVIDKKTNRQKIHQLCETLIKCAIGYEERKRVTVKGKTKIVATQIPPDVVAIRDIFDRVEGKSKQQVEFKADTRHEIVYRTVEEVRQSLRERGVPIEEVIGEVIDVQPQPEPESVES